jgi:hypothetical protein
MAHFVEIGDGAFVNLDLVAEISYDEEAGATSYRIIGESIWRSCKGFLLELWPKQPSWTRCWK